MFLPTFSVMLLVIIGCGGRNDRDAGASSEPASPSGHEVEPMSSTRPDGKEPDSTSANPDAPPTVLPEELSRIPGMIEAGWFETAQKRVDEYVKEHGESGPTVFLTGLILHKQKQYAQAQEYFERALEISPDFAVVHHFFGYCLYNLGDFEGAKREFTAHIEAQPEEGDSHFGLGLIALEENRLDDAETQFRTAIKLNEQIALYDVKRFEGRKPDIAKCRARLADVFIARSDYERARDELLHSIDIYDRHYSVYHTLSTVYRRLGDDERADEALRVWENVRNRERPELRNDS